MGHTVGAPAEHKHWSFLSIDNFNKVDSNDDLNNADKKRKQCYFVQFYYYRNKRCSWAADEMQMFWQMFCLLCCHLVV